MNEKTRVLVVEDESIVARALPARLETLGYAVVGVVASGEEAIEQAGELSPDLVLMDIRLHGAMDGIEAAGQIQEGCDIPVVYVTAHADQATLDRAALTGPYGYLLKPAEEGALHAAIEIAVYKHGTERRLKERAHLVPFFVQLTNNPLAIILGFSELLIDELEGSHRNDALKIFEEAQRAMKVQADLLLFFGRPSSQVNATEILQRALKSKADDFRVNHIAVQLDLAADVSEVMADEIQLPQVFINILDNAQQAMAEAHGRGNLRIQIRRLSDTLRISFSDDGPGISKDRLNRIFDPFFTRRSAGGGGGLGLFVSRAMVIDHRGKLWAESELGSGATFHLELPLSPSPFNPRLQAQED